MVAEEKNNNPENVCDIETELGLWGKNENVDKCYCCRRHFEVTCPASVSFL